MNETTDSRLQPLRERWQALGRRERAGVALAAVAVALLLLWSLAIRPAWQVVRDAPPTLQALDAQLQQMRQLAAEAAQLRDLAPLTREQSLQALQAATAALGERARLNVQAERVVVQFSGVPPQTLQTWLHDVRSQARARPVEATLTRSGAEFQGNVVLALGVGP